MATDTTLRPGEIKDILLREINAADLRDFDVEFVEVGGFDLAKENVLDLAGSKKGLGGHSVGLFSGGVLSL